VLLLPVTSMPSPELGVVDPTSFVPRTRLLFPATRMPVPQPSARTLFSVLPFDSTSQQMLPFPSALGPTIVTGLLLVICHSGRVLSAPVSFAPPWFRPGMC